ncbi:MAG: type II secretion system F family protein [Lentisphaeria bacterium]|nr:type II secretion system F family protein [Lentisphaeria bacterium]
MTTDNQRMEFYRQLALLARSNLPLPEGVRGMVASCGSRAFRDVLRQTADALAAGETLESCLARHPGTFPQLHRSLLAGAERAGLLPEALDEVAFVARQTSLSALLLRDALTYPALTLWFSATVVLLMMRFHLPAFGEDLRVMYEQPLPAVSSTLFTLSQFVCRVWPAVVAVYVIGTLGAVWLLGGFLGGRRMLTWVIARLPGARGAVSRFSEARICALWSVLLSRGAPLVEAAEMAAAMMECPESCGALGELAEEFRRGVSLDNAESLEAAVGVNVALCMRHMPEQELPERLAKLGESLREEGNLAMQRFGNMVSLSALGFMALVCGGMIIALFAPLVELYKHFTSCG